MARRQLALVVLALTLGMAAQDASAERQVAEFTGKASGNTGEFDVRAPWIMDWLVAGEPGEYEVADIALVNANTGMFEGVVVRSKTAGNGVRLFDKSGRYYFRVDSSMMNWRIKVVQLTPEEAEQYTPKTGSSILDR